MDAQLQKMHITNLSNDLNVQDVLPNNALLID